MIYALADNISLNISDLAYYCAYLSTEYNKLSEFDTIFNFNECIQYSPDNEFWLPKSDFLTMFTLFLEQFPIKEIKKKDADYIFKIQQALIGLSNNINHSNFLFSFYTHIKLM